MENIYKDGTYFKKNPTWDKADSSWKAKQIIQLINRNNLKLSTVCEVGCGAGEILNQLSKKLGNDIKFTGYEISPQAFDMCQKNSKENLKFYLKDPFVETKAFFDVVMAIDVFEHVEDYYGFLRQLKEKGRYKIFHIPLDLSVQTVFRSSKIINVRKSSGHIHYFTKKTALATLEDTEYDFFYGASLKTLLPTIKFGGDESLFHVWMFVKTPEGYMFPATFYYGPSGTSIGGWLLYKAEKVFPPEFFSLINFSPFDLSHDELDAFVEAIELSLKMVPMTDYYGVSRGDHGYTIMGVKNGKPYLTDLGWVYDEIKVDKQLGEPLDLNKRYYVEGYVEEQNYATWCVDCILEQEIEVPHYPIFINKDEYRPVCEICDKELKIKEVEYINELNDWKKKYS